ncbi:serine/arginine repetitive matrix protein 1 isoform X2 [Chironomus tepperi]|uniref:serine/arginine repetitive matrix protein 1 isoform X2 n=1 Tax=Chironomus tepperi TaxID=113505 RepID=UPI00391F179D
MSARRRSPFDGPERIDRIKGNMRMDRKPNATRISDPSHPYGKRKEIDNVMKKARQQPANEYWDKKLLEAEEKDPGRWKHSGYKKMYVNGVRRSRSPVIPGMIRKTPPQRHMQQVPNYPVRRRAPTPEKYRPKSPPLRYARKSPPPPRNDLKPKEIPYRPKRPMSPPPPKARTPSISSCSDSQCSGCSSDDDDRRVVDKRHRTMSRHGPINRMRPMSPEEVEHISKKKVKDVSPKRRHLKRPASPEIEKTRREITSPIPRKKDKSDKARTRIKIEGEKRRRRSPSSGSDDSTSSGGTFSALTATTRISLNERFGKMAQWNNDRKYDMSNMKITKNSEGGDRSAVMIQEQNLRESPMRSFSFSQYTKGEGHYPEELLQHSSAQALGLNAWDDVRVRFDYYKSKGYLRDLTLQDYIKWEEWWYRYQEWLKQERYFEMIERNMMRRRRKKIPIQQRLN